MTQAMAAAALPSSVASPQPTTPSLVSSLDEDVRAIGHGPSFGRA